MTTSLVASRRARRRAFLKRAVDYTWSHRLAIERATFFSWLGVVLVALCHHEYWRDEVRALSYARDAQSFGQLLAFLKDDGHPMLWHLLLKLGLVITGSNLALPLVSLTVAVAAVWLLLFKSQLALPLKVLFVLGALPIYEYSVMARNYGISMLLLFAFATAYPYRRTRPLLLGTLLGLLCNTNVHSLLLAALLGGLWVWDTLVRDRVGLASKQALQLAGGCLIAASGLALALFTIWPSDQMLSSDRVAPGWHDIVGALLRAILHPAGELHASRGVLLDAALDLLLITALLPLLRAPRLLLVAVAACVSLSMFFQLVYPSAFRHRGLLVVFLLALLWIANEEPQRSFAGITKRLNQLGNASLLLLLMGLVAVGVGKLANDLRQPLSSSQKLAEFLGKHRGLSQAVLIGEPDYLLESLPYYATNPTYIAREQRFGKAVRFVRSARLDFTLGELLAAARRVQASRHVPVVIAIGAPLNWGPSSPPPGSGRGRIAYGHQRTFAWSAAELAAWRANTKFLGKLSDAAAQGDEVYALFALNPEQRTKQTLIARQAH